MTEVLLAILALGFFLRGGRRRGGRGPDLPATLAGAEDAGIISGAQREQILAWAAEHGGRSSRLGGATWLAVFAGLFVVAGVALLIARNWQDIGPIVRVGTFVGVLAVIGEAAIRARERALGLSLSLELLWFFLPLLGIGLYGQTFQLSGDPVQPLLVWLALTAPLAWLSQRPVVATLHTLAIVTVLFTGNFLLDSAAEMFRGRDAAPTGVLTLVGDGSPTAWLLTAFLLTAIVVQSLRLLPRAHRHHFVGVVAAWVMALLLAPTPLRLRHGGWLIVAAVALATAWVVAVAALDTSSEERATGLVVWLGTLYALTFTWHLSSVPHDAAGPRAVAVVLVAIIAAVGGALALPPSRFSPHHAWGWGAKLLLIATVAVALLYLVPNTGAVWTAAMTFNVILAVAAIALMWHGALVGDVAQINLGVGTLVAVLITRFLDLFGGMLRSGIGFIVAGVLLAVLSWALERTRRRLIGVSREAAP
jgi:uncharacterized membrane protein